MEIAKMVVLMRICVCIIDGSAARAETPIVTIRRKYVVVAPNFLPRVECWFCF